jgi:hypothetical protein
MPCVIGRRGIASKTRRPSEIGITIIPAFNISSVVHASTSKRTIRSTKPYLQIRNKFTKVRNNKVYVDTYMIEYKSISNGRCKKIS